MLQGWKMRDMNLRHRLARVEISTRANWCRKFMSRIFTSCIFDRPVFSCLAFSVAPRHAHYTQLRRSASICRTATTTIVRRFVFHLRCPKDDLHTGRRTVERRRRGLRLRRCGRSSRISLLLVRSLKCTQLFRT